MDPFSIIFVLVMLFERVIGLRCYAGNPSRKHECNSLSYCLVVVSRSGRSQWSCDGNAFSQVSLCANLGMDNPRHTIYEAPPSSSSFGSFFRNNDPETNSYQAKNERLYFVKQQIDPRLSKFVGDGSVEEKPEAAALTSRKDGKRCFDAGDLGRICCCSTDFCNDASISRVFHLTIILPVLSLFLQRQNK